MIAIYLLYVTKLLPVAHYLIYMKHMEKHFVMIGCKVMEHIPNHDHPVYVHLLEQKHREYVMPSFPIFHETSSNSNVPTVDVLHIQILLFKVL